MNIILLFFFGFIFSFVGSITPSMLNMTALKISLEKGKLAANKYAFGVSLIIIPQVIIAVVLTKYIAQNPTILETLEKVGIVVFIALSYYFYNESKKGKIKIDEVNIKEINPLLTGISLSVLNMFGIPFFSGTIITLDVFKLFSFDTVSVLFFTLGSVLGTFYILFLYGKFAKVIQQKTGKLTKDINLILSIITGLVAVFTFIKLFI
ncbi:glutamate dehydrogenase [Polaribacter undariae]|uniref:Glutamate dehydrogenase n=1 Tax=Polaribacter sejongensis TaxID=985043 RepID=A0AAJ1VFB3_9FLAO|nr:glutamate dehydrogenase [Polaribacter undariae]MDN3618164.1 glutamate dehydrogenase [Polaribacter undariae]UWD30846.1 glutamate dehydrogenase [Polaribacter undariae]